MGMVRRTKMASGIVKLEVNGAVDLDEGLSAISSVYADVGESSFLRTLVDLTNATSFPDPTQTRALAAFVERKRPKIAGRAAFVAPTDAAFGVARMAEANLQSTIPETKVFRNSKDAEEWLLQADGC